MQYTVLDWELPAPAQREREREGGGGVLKRLESCELRPSAGDQGFQAVLAGTGVGGPMLRLTRWVSLSVTTTISREHIHDLQSVWMTGFIVPYGQKKHRPLHCRKTHLASDTHLRKASNYKAEAHSVFAMSHMPKLWTQVPLFRRKLLWDCRPHWNTKITKPLLMTVALEFPKQTPLSHNKCDWDTLWFCKNAGKMDCPEP